MKIKILDKKAVSFESADFFSGAYTVTGTEVTFMVTSCDKAGMVSVGQTDFVASEGKEVTLFFPRMNEEEALFALQQKAEIEGVNVIRVIKSTWVAKDAYGRPIVCDTEEEAQEAHKKFGEPSRIDDTSYIVVEVD